jgi:DNA-binding MarR family transcriptional regulator
MNSCQGDSVGRLIYLTSQSLRNYAENHLKPYALTVEQVHVLKNISTGTGIVQAQLSEIVGKNPANITRILDRLEKKLCIERRKNPEDRRSILIFLTRSGEELLQEIGSLFAELEQTITAGIDLEQQQVLKNILGRINLNIESAVKESDK